MIPRKGQMCYFIVAHRYECICGAMPPGVSNQTVLLYCLSWPNTSYCCRAWHVSSVTWLLHQWLYITVDSRIQSIQFIV